MTPENILIGLGVLFAAVVGLIIYAAYVAHKGDREFMRFHDENNWD